MICFFFAFLVAHFAWTHLQYNVKNAYLYAAFIETVFMFQSLGFEIKGIENYICKLNKALYAFHQSGRV